MALLQDLEAAFPLLVGTGYTEESLETDTYNCIAFAFGDTNNWWWPRRGYGSYWPPGFALNDSIDVLISIFELHGYRSCSDGVPEHGYEKVAIYTKAGRIKHAARLLRSGRWASKLGEEQDIEHESVEHLNSRSYGDATHFMKRERADWV